MKKLVSGIMLTLLLTSMLTLAFNIQQTKSSPTTIIVPDDYPTIQGAINAASHGDTIFVRAGTYYENVVVTKTVSLVGESPATTIIDGNGTSAVVHITQDGVNVTNFTLRNGLGPAFAYAGIQLDYANLCNISGNTITANNWWGILLRHSSNYNAISGNNITNNHDGICLIESSNNNISGNNIANNAVSGAGIGLWYSSNYNGISRNNITNNDYGFYLVDSSNNNIARNNIANNGGGFYLTNSSNNNIVGNNITNNNYYGIYFTYVSNNNNIIYHNNFVSNTNQVDGYPVYVNVWDDGYPSGGNYWSDYKGFDEKSGPNQTQSGSDGIGDTPYVINANNQDRYPLMKPWTPTPPFLIEQPELFLNESWSYVYTRYSGANIEEYSWKKMVADIEDWNGSSIYKIEDEVLKNGETFATLTTWRTIQWIDLLSSRKYEDKTVEVTFDPGYKNYEFPLYVGKEWSNLVNVSWTATYTDGRIENGSYTLQDHSKVIEEETITVKAGAFRTLVIKVDYMGSLEGYVDYVWFSSATKSFVKYESYFDGSLIEAMELQSFVITLPPSIDTTPPTTPVVTDDGEYTSSTTWLHAAWSSSDPESGIAEYQYAIGTSPGGTDVVGWTSTGTTTEVTHSGLNLVIGGTYYLSVKAINVKRLWSAVGTSDGITVARLTLSLSQGWDTKELFVPIYHRSDGELGTFEIGAFNRRDMWYLIEVYKRKDSQNWEEIFPWDFPYLTPYSQRTFRYSPEAREEVKLVVLNDLNDKTLTALWALDFAARALLGVSMSPQVTETEEFFVTLATFALKLTVKDADVVGFLCTGQYKKAVIALGKLLATDTGAQNLFRDLLADVGVQVTIATIVSKALLMSFTYAVNAIVWWPLYQNTNKEPFMEDVIFTAKYRVPPAIPNIRVTKSLTILQKETYYVGQTIDAQFTVINKGTAPITFNVLTVGGRGPKGEADVRDFTFRTDITLNPGGSYNYKGELKLLDNGTYHFFIAYQTPDGKWETIVPTETGITNTVDIFVNPIPEKWLVAQLGSPGELRVYDSQGRITGLINGVEKIEIPYSTYYDNIVVILAPTDSYNYDVVGTSGGSYSLMIMNGTAQEIATFNATDIPTSANAIHRYAIDFVALTRGEEGATIQIDSNGDGAFEKTFASNDELTRDEFMFQVRPEEAFPLWIAGVAVAAIAIVTMAIAVFRRKRKQSSIKKLS